MPTGAPVAKPARAALFRPVLVLLSWTAVAQVVSAAGMLLLPRLFDPHAFGVFSLYAGVVVLGGVVAAARYEFAIGLPGDDREATALFWLCLSLALLTGLVAAAVLALLPAGNRLFVRFADLLPWWNWVAAGATAVAWFNAANYIALRHGRFAAVGQSKALIALATGLGQVLGGLLVTPGPAALIVPFLLGQLAGFAMLLLATRRQLGALPDMAEVRGAASRYVRFPTHVAPGSLLDGLAVLLPLAVVAATQSVADAGAFALADRTLRMPVTLIGSSMLQVFYKRLADIRGDSVACRALLLTSWGHLALVTALPTLIVVLYGEPIFVWLFGSTWAGAGHSAQTLAIGIAVFFVGYPTSNILVVNERTRSFLVWQVAQLVAMVAALAAAAGLGGGLDVLLRCVVAAQVSVTLLSMALQWRAAGDTRAAPLAGTA